MSSARPHRKRPKGKRRELEPLEDIDAQDGPKMLALPTARHRAFVRALYDVKPGFGFAVKAAKLSGWGTETSSPQSMATISSRLMHDERVLEAIHEEDQKRIRASAPRAIRALSHLIETPSHKDHARGIGMVLDRVHPLETSHTVKVQHDVTENFKETAKVHERIAELAAKFNVKLPPPKSAEPAVIDGEFSVVRSGSAP